MLKEILFQSIKRDFFDLFEIANQQEIYGCAIYTDEDFLASSLVINTVEKGKQFQSKNDYWNTYFWSFHAHSFNVDEMCHFNQEVINFYGLEEGKEFELRKEAVFQLLIEGLQCLRSELKAIMDIENICFFITLSDGDIEYIENHSAKQINSGFILKAFLDRFK